MNVHIGYKVRKTPDLEKEVHIHVEKLRKRLQAFRPELVHLKGMVEQSSPREGTVVSLNLRLPSGQMAAARKAPLATAAIKAAFDDLLHQITRHKDLLRSTHKFPRWRRGGEPRPGEQVPFEDTIASMQAPLVSGDDIRTYININLSRLDYVSSAGLRVFLVASKRLTPAGGKVVLCSLQEPVKQVFDIVGFYSIFSILNSKDEALNSLR